MKDDKLSLIIFMVSLFGYLICLYSIVGNAKYDEPLILQVYRVLLTLFVSIIFYYYGKLLLSDAGGLKNG